MPINKLKCPQCGKPAVTKKEYTVGGLSFKTYECGHTETVKELKASDFAGFQSYDNHRPMPFQVQGALHVIKSGGRALILDEQGLGKTVQFCMVLWSHPKEMCRSLILCKAGLKVQLSREIPRWCGEDWIPQIVGSENDYIVPGTKVLILSFDTLWRFKDIPGWMQKYKIKSICLDEVQHIKNGDSKRTVGVQLACREVPYVIGLSGTPIKNHAGEYFNILNIVRPDKFRERSNFGQVWVDTYWNGKTMKYGGIKDLQAFDNYTKDFIIRRTRNQVMPELPNVTRMFRFSELGSVVEEAYKNTLKEFQEYYNYGSAGDSAIVRQSNILAYLAKMRHITGISKVESVVDYVDDFINETDRKIVIFAHHLDVGNALMSRLSELRMADPQTWGCPVLSIQGISADKRAPIVDLFARDGYRILIAGETSSAEGLNLQFCSDTVIMERQWNPANEEQVEGRFIRIGQKMNKVNAMYPIAVGTVDEFFSELVEKKRSYCNLDPTKKVVWSESSLIQELAEVLAMSGGRKWGW